MLRSNTLGCRLVFLLEKRTEPYKRYGEESIAEENTYMRQELPQSPKLCLGAGGRGV